MREAAVADLVNLLPRRRMRVEPSTAEAALPDPPDVDPPPPEVEFELPLDPLEPAEEPAEPLMAEAETVAEALETALEAEAELPEATAPAAPAPAAAPAAPAAAATAAPAMAATAAPTPVTIEVTAAEDSAVPNGSNGFSGAESSPLAPIAGFATGAPGSIVGNCKLPGSRRLPREPIGSLGSSAAAPPPVPESPLFPPEAEVEVLELGEDDGDGAMLGFDESVPEGLDDGEGRGVVDGEEV